LVIQFLLIHLAKGARACLEHLLVGTMHDWADLRRAFVGNFQGTYKRPGSSWDYIYRLSKKGNELSDTTNADVVSAFTYITTNKPYYMSSNGGDRR
jgi:hypothetical protein